MIKSQSMKYRIREEVKETIEVWGRRIYYMKNYGLVNLIIEMHDQRLMLEMDRKATEDFEDFEHSQRNLMNYSQHIVSAFRRLGMTDDEIAEAIMKLPEFCKYYNDYPLKNWFKNSIWREGIEKASLETTLFFGFVQRRNCEKICLYLWHKSDNIYMRFQGQNGVPPDAAGTTSGKGW